MEGVIRIGEEKRARPSPLPPALQPASSKIERQRRHYLREKQARVRGGKHTNRVCQSTKQEHQWLVRRRVSIPVRPKRRSKPIDHLWCKRPRVPLRSGFDAREHLVR